MSLRHPLALPFALALALVAAACGRADAPAADAPAVDLPPPVVADEASVELAAPTAAGDAAADDSAAVTEAPDAPAAGARAYLIDPARSEARYEVGETFFRDNRFAVAVGRTSGIAGRVMVDEADPAASAVDEIAVDVGRLASDSAKRDRYLGQNALASATFPTARFVGRQIIGLPADPRRGEPVAFKIAGELTVRDQTRPVTWDVTATLSADALSGTATTRVLMSEFGIGPIKIMQLATEDEVALTLDFVAVPE